MKIRVLGCSGGLTASSGSTCIGINEVLLIDAGTGLSNLSLAEMRQVRYVVLTHSHMDHIAALPLFLSNMFEQVEHQVQIFAQQHTIATLQANIFNDAIWPDFSKLPTPERPVMQFITVQPGDELALAGLRIKLFPVDHTVPTVGVSVADGEEHFVFSADTTAGPLLDAELAKLEPIDTLMIECSFVDAKHELAVHTKHMTPAMVRATIARMAVAPKHVWISHLKPSCAAELREELQDFHVLE